MSNRAVGPRVPHVLIVSHNGQLGGAETFLIALTRRLVAEGVQVSVQIGQDGPLRARLEALGTVVVTINMLDQDLAGIRKSAGWRGVMQAASKLPALLRAAWCVKRTATARGATVVHAYSMKADFYGALGARLARVPCVIQIHDVLSPRQFPWVYRTAVTLAANLLSDVVVCSSESVRRSFVASGGRAAKARVIGYGVELAGLDGGPGSGARELVEQVRARPSDPIVALVGRFAPWKGQDLFVDAAARIVAQWPNCRFLLVGGALFSEDVSFEKQIFESIDSKRLTKHVFATGFRSDAASIMHLCDIVVSCSRAPEAGPLVLMEAMAAGRIVVAVNDGNVPDVVMNGETGILVSVASASSVAEGIAAVLHMPRRDRERMGRRALARASDKFDIRACAAEWARLYRSLGETPNGGR